MHFHCGQIFDLDSVVVNKQNLFNSHGGFLTNAMQVVSKIHKSTGRLKCSEQCLHYLFKTGSHDFHPLRFGSHKPNLWKSNCVSKMLLFFETKCCLQCLVSCTQVFVCIFKHVYVQLCLTMLKLKLMKYILLCPDIYSMIQSLQTGMSKNIVDPYQTAPKG